MNDPAVLFYTSDFLTGVMDMTMEERGQYITLLCYQHQKGHIEEKTIRLLVGLASVNVLKHFVKDENGNYYNKRMDIEKEKRRNFTESRRKNGSLGGRPSTKNNKPSGKPTKNHMDNLMGNENDNENINENNKDIFTFIEEQFGRMLYPAEIELISTWEDNELTRYAIKETVLNNANSLKYTQAILNSYKAKNITTIAQAQKESKKIKVDVPAWMNEERKEKDLTDEQKRILAKIRGSD